MIVPGMKLPDFETTACVSIEPGREFKDVRSSDARDKWLVLYTYPKDFTFVCPTEIVEFDNKLSEFEDRDAIVYGGSTDNEHSHLAWRKSHADLSKLRHALLYYSPQMMQALGIAHPDAGVALRATIVVDPDGIVRFAAANDLDVGRNVAEVLRVLDGLQTGELCPCNWQKGEDTLTQQMRKTR